MIDPVRQKVLIADDEPLARERIRRLVDVLETYEVCGEASNGDSTLQAVADLEPDIILLDIRMPGMDGMEVAEQLNTIHNPPAIIFCTAYDHYAIAAFEVHAVAYVLKPVRREALSDALARAGRVNRVQLRALSSAPDAVSNQLVVRTHRGTELIELSRIHFCEADQKCVTIHHDRGETVTDHTLKELENTYPDELLRIHRHTLVGVRFIQGLERTGDGHYKLALRDRASTLSVSRRHATAVRQWLNDLQPG
ncbi:MAG: LytTR family DNA-binding domain-containing protein [Marinobacter sp.]|uniref:LytR/AlgR family response regulator transcription factor n=1 Tax=Marinobacter sp. TaxID=50741 RepID=UPI0034A0A487